ncbi:MAG: DUF2071 domain-containing protein [Myxococcales bacterium]|nr:DUF2071 domain-containing protein [Myxococcales bacterium]
MTRTVLTGREALTLEVELGCEATAARSVLPTRLELDVHADGWASVSVLLFSMEQMRVKGLPTPGLAYHEVLWRLRARLDGSPVFFAVACDLDHPLVRGLGATLIRYPVRRSRFEFSESSFKASAAEGVLYLCTQPVEGSAAPVVQEPLPVFSRQGEALFRIPWEETPTPERTEVQLEVRDDSLASRTMHGALRWPRRAVSMRGRRHHCGFASRVR